MYKIIGGDKKEYGPATAEELRRWIAEGRLSGQSLVQAEGGEWKVLATFPEFAEALLAQTGQAPSAATPAAPLSAEAWSAQILAHQPPIRIGECLARGWELLKANFGLLFGATFLVWLLDLLCQFTPFIGPIIHWLISGVLYGGLSLVFLKRIRGQPAAANDAFAGFSLAFGQLVLAGLITSLLVKIGAWCCLILPGVYLFIAWIFTLPLVADKRLEYWSAMELSRKTTNRVWFELLGLAVVAFLPFILVSVFVEIRISASVYPLMQDLFASSTPNFEHLMSTLMEVAKRSLPLVLLTKCVLMLNLPFAMAALMYAYEDLFGTRTTPRP
jgi:hypothetical protein